MSSGIALMNVDRFVKEQAKKENLTVYGAQSIKKHIGPFARPTTDWDILSPHPKQSAQQLQRTLDKGSPGQQFFSKPAMHPGTYKVQHVGRDGKPNTRDDLEVADFTKPTRKHKTKVIDEVRYTQLSESIRDKRSSLNDEEFYFRHEKDREDLERINEYKRFKQFNKPMWRKQRW